LVEVDHQRDLLLYIMVVLLKSLISFRIKIYEKEIPPKVFEGLAEVEKTPIVGSESEIGDVSVPGWVLGLGWLGLLLSRIE